jgi:metal-responsive CopG/Arc/MetJ family transcriptional regulator
MARKQVLVQLDDELVAALDGLAEDLGINRSELLRRAAHSVLEMADEIQADLEHEAAYRRVPEDRTWADAYAKMVAKVVAPEDAPPYEAR